MAHELIAVIGSAALPAVRRGISGKIDDSYLNYHTSELYKNDMLGACDNGAYNWVQTHVVKATRLSKSSNRIAHGSAPYWRST